MSNREMRLPRQTRTEVHPSYIGNLLLVKSYMNRIILYSYKSFNFNIFWYFEDCMNIAVDFIYELQNRFLSNCGITQLNIHFPYSNRYVTH